MKFTRRAFFLTLLLLLAVSPCMAQVRQPESITVRIGGGASLSDTANLAGCTPAAIITPSAWTSASIAFQSTIDGTNFFKVYDQFGTRVSLTVSTSQWVVFQPADTWSFFSVKLESIDGSGTAVTQTAAREIKIVCRK